VRIHGTDAASQSATVADVETAEVKARRYKETEVPATGVVFVQKCNAKVVKTELERHSFLDRRFRMTPARSALDQVAVPVTDSFLSLVVGGEFKSNAEYHHWSLLVEGQGTQEMPFSTSQFAKKKK
jgi:hypothetical protein